MCSNMVLTATEPTQNGRHGPTPPRPVRMRDDNWSPSGIGEKTNGYKVTNSNKTINSIVSGYSCTGVRVELEYCYCYLNTFISYKINDWVGTISSCLI